MKINKKIINSLYENFKDSPKKLKIVCDWDEVIQACEPYALWKTLVREGERKCEFSDYFEAFWQGGTSGKIVYSPYVSKLEVDWYVEGKDKEQSEIKNSPNFYQQAPFLTIAEGLLKLIKEDKVEQLIFLSTYDKKKFPDGDYRKGEIFRETFGKFWERTLLEATRGGDLKEPVCSLELIPFDNENQGESKVDWIKENASDFDIVIDDNPLICKSVIEMELENKENYERHQDECMGCSDCADFPPIKKVLAPYYPTVESQHHHEVLLIKVSVSDLKKEKFI